METSQADYEQDDLQRGLKPRHMQMIAIGGAIGVGLFYGSSGAIQYAGPAVLLAYAIAGLAIFFVCRAVGEIAVEEPVAGATVAYASRYIHPFAGFALGWTGLLGCIGGIGAEFSALGAYVQYWFPQVPTWVSGAVALAVIAAVNLVSVSSFGEMEFWLSAIKVVTILAMIACGSCIIVTGLGDGGHAALLHNLTASGGFLPNGLTGLMFSLVLVAFAFGGTDSVACASGEAANVKKTLPKAVNGVFWRIMIFYVGATLVMLCMWPWNKLAGVGSPFVQVFSQIGIPAAASIINFVVITASLSSLNSGMYLYSRQIYNLALQGRAPKALAKVSKHKVPYASVLTISAGQILGVLLMMVLPERAFELCSAIVVFMLVFGWVCELLSELHFRTIKRREGKEDELTFKMPWWPYSNIFALAFMALILVMMAIMPAYRITYLVTVPWMLMLFVVYRVQERSRAKRELAVDVSRGVAVTDGAVPAAVVAAEVADAEPAAVSAAVAVASI
ncbi:MULTISPECIES: amino acid permease [Bifidobacterium]|uniref:amino acid permease n=1 Tax=Bifidobacterium TaxID=1678 RepID=UPI001BDBCCBE|nr:MULTISPECIES: amino acid permease [Bifidobacterium]MBT1162598.1 amino acid permease [Bifidobacterium sp. SO1]MBW3079683.1 amino acid permease [Bifidobacterium simiiventris]